MFKSEKFKQLPNIKFLSRQYSAIYNTMASGKIKFLRLLVY